MQQAWQHVALSMLAAASYQPGCCPPCSTKRPGSRGKPLLGSVGLLCFPCYRSSLQTVHRHHRGYVRWVMLLLCCATPLLCVCVTIWPLHHRGCAWTRLTLGLPACLYVASKVDCKSKKAAVSGLVLFFCLASAGERLFAELIATGTPHTSMVFIDPMQY